MHYHKTIVRVVVCRHIYWIRNFRFESQEYQNIVDMKTELMYFSMICNLKFCSTNVSWCKNSDSKGIWRRNMFSSTQNIRKIQKIHYPTDRWNQGVEHKHSYRSI